MSRIKICLVFLFSCILSQPLSAKPVELKQFTPGSYQHLLDRHTGQAFVLVIWSVTCSSCLKDMALLNEIHKANPAIGIVMLSTDDTSAKEQAEQILVKNELSGLDNWYFADENPQKLRYEIDPRWYGELPRTYFWNKAHERIGVSGVLSKGDYEKMFKNILN